jgi:2-(1,2-epoxy-1,2-dihydrophenyl)acetyl-CoA isomerase
MPEPVVLVAREGGVATITLNRPQALNALDHDLTVGLRDSVLAAEHDPAVRCLVLRGGEHFMAGGDLKWFSTLIADRSSGENRVQFEALIHEVHTVILGLRRMPKPVLASVRGAVAGFGMSLMMACDLALAADSAYFTLAYTLIGTSPDGGSTFALPRIVGQKKAMEIALLGERFDAASAERLGLVNRVVPKEKLEEETAKLAARLAAGPTAVYARTKALLNGSLNATLESQLQREAEAFAQSASEPDFREGLAAFIEKRKPQWHR